MNLKLMSEGKEDEEPIEDLDWKLTEKQKRFCQEYVIDLNKKQAAIRAGYSENTAYNIGWENVNKPEVAAYIKHLRTNLEEATGVTQNRIIRELQRIAFSDMGRFKTNWMTMKEFEELTEDDRAAISSIDYTERPTEFGTETIIKFKLHDKLKAQEMLNRMLGYNAAEKIEVKEVLTPEERQAKLRLIEAKIEAERKNK